MCSNDCMQVDLGGSILPLVSQVYCSALSCSYSGVPVEYWEQFATLVLDACYEASVWAALSTSQPTARRDPHTLYLTFLGGGVFGNKPEWIAGAIARAIALAYLKNARINIIVCHYKHIDKRLQELIDNTVADEINGKPSTRK
jgi:hypothetical protein